MITTLLIDLVNTIITFPTKPRDELSKLLGISSPYSIDNIAYSLCFKNPRMKSQEFINRFIEELRILEFDGNKSLEEKIKWIWNESTVKAEYIKGARETLDKLRISGYKMILVSNTTPPTWDIIHRLGINQFFDSIVLSCDVGYIKPDTNIFRIALDSVGASRELTCMVGDKWITDMQGAINFEIYGIYIDSNTLHPKVNGVTSGVIASVPSFSYIPNILINLMTCKGMRFTNTKQRE